MDYRFVDKDPAIDVIRQGLERSPLTIYQVSQETYKHGQGVAVKTIQQWLYGNTMRPRRYSMEVVMMVLGIDTQFVWQETGKRVDVPKTFKPMPKSWLSVGWRERKARKEKADAV